MSKFIKIGAPNSIARYVSETVWGKNTHCVMKYVGNRPVCRAAGSLKHCQQFLKLKAHYIVDGCILIDLSAYFPPQPPET